jgi:hypothetical protein
MHNKAIDATCSTCHKMDDAGGTSNTSLCSNSVCHGSFVKFAGFNAQSLRTVLQEQLIEASPTPTPTPEVTTA